MVFSQASKPLENMFLVLSLINRIKLLIQLSNDLMAKKSPWQQEIRYFDSNLIGKTQNMDFNL